MISTQKEKKDFLVPKISIQTLVSQGKNCEILRELADQVSQFAHINLPTFIYGGYGVGKRTIARLLHTESSLSEWIEIDITNETVIKYVAQVIEKILEKNSYTIYIPNIEKLPIPLQEQLCKIISENETSKSRIIVSSRENIFFSLQKNAITPDFFTLFSSLPIELPTIEASFEYRKAIVKWYSEFFNKKIPTELPSLWPENIRSVRTFIEEQ